MNKRAWCYGTGALVLVAGVAAGGTFAFRRWVGAVPASAVASNAPVAAPMNNKVDTILDLVRQERSAAPSPATRPAPAATQSVPAQTTPAQTTPAATTPPAPPHKAAPPARSIAPAAPRPAPAGRLTHDERVVLETVTQLHTLRSAIDAWKVQHRNQVPDFARFPAWQQFTQRDGRGPVLGQPPVNPLNGESRVLPVQGEIKPGLTVKGGSFGFVYSLANGTLWATDEVGAVFDDAAVDTLALRVRAVKELSPQEAQQSVTNVLTSLRSQLALFASQHDDRTPDFARYPAFEQFLKRTYSDGRIVEGKAPAGARLLGPYFQAAPINALNGGYKVAVVSGGVRPGQKVDAPGAGFVFSKANNRLYATDAAGRVIDEDKLSAAPNTATPAPDSPTIVHQLRTQIALYKLQHDGKLPDPARFPKWEQLTSRTRTDGSPDPAGRFGPYLAATPVNPRNGSSDIETVEKIPDGWVPTRRVGFIYESSTGRVWLTDERWSPVAN